MKSFIRELRRREVFRTAGLYVGIAWIVIEVGSVLLPAFDAPAWIIRWLVVAGLVGFPVALILAWVFDVTEHGVVMQQEGDDSPVPPLGSRRNDFVVIAVLTVALTISVYLNFTGSVPVAEPREPVTVAIGRFEYPVELSPFNGALEILVTGGLERAGLLDVVDPLQSAPADARVMLSGTAVRTSDGFRVTLRAIDASSGDELATAQTSARLNELPGATVSAAGEMLNDLGLAIVGDAVSPPPTLPALGAYAAALAFLRAGELTEANGAFASALEQDPDFALAWARWGLSLQAAGQDEAARLKWQRAMPLLEQLDPRQRNYLLARYHAEIDVDDEQAMELLAALLEDYPADARALILQARLQAANARHKAAFASSEALLTLYPHNAGFQAAHAGYALRAGHVDLAAMTAGDVHDAQPAMALPLQVLADAAVFRGHLDTARTHFELLQQLADPVASSAALAKADLALLEGQTDAATALLDADTATRQDAGDRERRVSKQLLLASAYVSNGMTAKALGLLEHLDRSLGQGQLVLAGELYVSAGRPYAATALAERLAAINRPAARASAGQLQGLLAFDVGDYSQAIAIYTAALRQADLWLLRYRLGQAYLAAGYPAEASAEFENCIERRGEASQLFMDGQPTWRYTRQLETWKDAANSALAGTGY